MAQGGDYEHGDGTGGESIYGKKFNDENFKFSVQKGVVAMANSGPDTNGSQFFIPFVNAPWLNGYHVVFGRVLKGYSVVEMMEQNGTESGEPHKRIEIGECKKVDIPNEFAINNDVENPDEKVVSGNSKRYLQRDF